MMKPRNLGALLALGALTALPACSMFGGGSNSSGSQYSQNSAAPNSYGAPGSYATASAATGTSGTVAPVSADMIRKVQSTLQQNGDYKGRVDGVWGPQTESGVRTWQQGHNLTSSGEIDMATLQSMNISNDSQADNQSGPTNTNTNTAATGPNGNQNYNTAPNRATGSNYSSNNSQAPANNPYPVNQGATSSPTGDTGTSGSSSNSAAGANANH
jgi:hypothetical protein